ncbi:MAG: hypothetical protein IKI61_10160 [Erysipelotrichaceae bacterium]|nr:hypothetical protein [Erysipelotrichaceae bacterium]
MKNVKTVLLILSVILILSGCTEKGQSSGCDLFDDCGETVVESQDMNFKEKYEALNGLENSSGKIHRVLSIPEEHPFKVTEPKTVIDKFVKGETFYLYIGDEACPWCRANIEKAIEVSKKAGIDEIFYLEIWDDDGNEILRDQYKVKDGSLVKSFEGTDSYQRLLGYLGDFLDDYTVEDDDGKKYDTGEKRIYVPSYFYIENGKAIRFTDATPDQLEDPREELSEEILNKETEMFTELFDVKE